MLDRVFRIRELNSTPLREILAGVTTFLTMAYILVVQPAVLSTDFAGQPTGLEPGAIFLATCLSSAIACCLMGIFAKLPIALAPGMGQNFFFVSVVMTLGAQPSPAEPWKGALGIVLVAGVLFLILTLVGVRQLVLDAISPSLRSAIVVGIGLFIAFIGLRNANIVTDAPSLVAFNATSIRSSDSLVFWLGLIVTLFLLVRRIPGSILIGLITSTTVAWLAGKVSVDQWIGFPEFTQAAAFQFDVRPAFTATGVTFVLVFLFMDIFDTTGTLIGVGQQAGLTDESGNLPRIRQAMLADAVGTVAGACLGTSTVTSYIESAAGVESGGRSGLTAVTVGVLFLCALCVSPAMLAIGGYSPITAPALVVVGAMMFRNVRGIDWSDETESIPSFLVILGIPLFFSIADGIALGLILWPALKIVKGRTAEVPWPAYLLTLTLLIYFLTIRVGI